ncbi:MAG: ASKHA domain-containing protein [Armatimonadota bacterium]
MICRKVDPRVVRLYNRCEGGASGRRFLCPLTEASTKLAGIQQPMMKNHSAVPTVTFLPSGRTIAVRDGADILRLAQQAGVSIPNTCGGAGTCGKCTVVLRGSVTPPTELETRILSTAQIAAGVRLACQAVPQGDVAVHVHDHSAASVLAEGVSVRFKLAPHVRKVPVALPQPSLEDQASDVERLLNALGLSDGVLRADLAVLKDLPSCVRRSDEGTAQGWADVTAVTAGDRLLAVEPGETSHASYGVAFDIGTTTVVGYLLDLNTGKCLATASDLNPQVNYGADVISRITHTMQDEGGLQRLRDLIVAKLNSLTQQVCDQAGVSAARVYDFSVAGNTTMLHLLLGLEVRNIAMAPYIPVFTHPLELAAAEVGLHAHPQARTFILPGIASYVGADIVADLLVAKIDRRPHPCLMIDFGTNGEIVLGSRERVLACATAAGPCFEGGSISCGMRAAPGAVSAVQRRGDDIVVQTIADEPPRGICGTGLIDAVAVMLAAGIIDETGRVVDPDEAPEIPGPLRRRIRSGDGGYRFVLCEAGERGAPIEIAITQRDVRELQNAKGAVMAGIRILCSELGIGTEGIEAALLAGAFGNYIRPESAVAVGLIPDLPLGRVRSLGNAAGTGAQMALLSTYERRRAERLSRKVEYIELSGDPRFPTEYAEAMYFPARG